MKTAKRIFKILLAAGLLYLLLNILPILPFKNFINKNPKSFRYVKGVFHIHSTFSDGAGDIQDIIRAAREADTGLDFLLLTDHGHPNPGSSGATGWHNDILLIGGTEISLHEGHLAAAGYPLTSYKLPPRAQESIGDINAGDGVSFISHPFDTSVPWTDWEVEGFTGLEIISMYSAARKKGPALLLSFPVQYLFDQDYALINLLEYPRQNLQRWDQLNRRPPYYGIYAIDAHAKLEISRRITLYYPSYTALFRILSVYVRVDDRLDPDAHRAARRVIRGLKSGDFFNVIEALAPANGFSAEFITGDGRTIRMGQSHPLTTPGFLRIRLPFQFATSLTVFRDGQAFHRLENNLKQDIRIPVTRPGNYRLEVAISRSKFHELPWILTNPFFLIDPGRPIPPRSPEVSTAPSVESSPLDLQGIRVETNPASTAALEAEHPAAATPSLIFTYHLVREDRQKDCWTALALRRPFDFSAYRGISLEARSLPDMRYWLELRTGSGDGTNRYRCSFLATDRWQTRFLPFDRLIPILGEEAEINLSAISSVFISVTNRIAYPDTLGTLMIREPRLVR